MAAKTPRKENMNAPSPDPSARAAMMRGVQITTPRNPKTIGRPIVKGASSSLWGLELSMEFSFPDLYAFADYLYYSRYLKTDYYARMNKRDEEDKEFLEFIRTLCPQLSEEELRKEAYHFEEYLKVVLRIYERREREKLEREGRDIDEFDSPQGFGV